MRHVSVILNVPWRLFSWMFGLLQLTFESEALGPSLEAKIIGFRAPFLYGDHAIGCHLIIFIETHNPDAKQAFAYLSISVIRNSTKQILWIPRFAQREIVGD